MVNNGDKVMIELRDNNKIQYREHDRSINVMKYLHSVCLSIVYGHKMSIQNVGHPDSFE